MLGLNNSIWAVVGLVCAIWVIFDVLTKKKSMTTGMKAVWIICAVLFSIITAIVYYFVEKR